MVPVGQATPEVIATADLVVVGGPTHAPGMTRTMSRTGAVEKPRSRAGRRSSTPDAEGEGLRQWFDALGQWPGLRRPPSTPTAR